MIKIERKGGKPRKAGKLVGLAGLGSPKPAKNPSLTGHKGNRFAKPVTLAKVGIKRDV